MNHPFIMKPIRLWRALTHPLLVIVLTGVLFVALAAHIGLPQTPTTLAEDPIARSRWLVETAASFPAGLALNALGLFDIAHNLFLRALLPLLALSLFLRLADRLALAQRTRRLQPPLEPAPTTQTTDLTFDQALTPEEGADLMTRWCERREETELGEGSIRQWHGDRHQGFTWFAALIELGLALLLLTLLLNARFGWQTDTLTLSPGERASLTPLAAITLSLPDEPETDLQNAAAAQIQVNGPTRFGLMIRQQTSHPALIVAATQGEKALAVQAIEQGGAPATRLTLRFPQPRSERAVAIPEHNLFLRLVNNGSSQFSLQVLDASNALLLAQEITEPTTVRVDDVEIHLQPTYFLVFRVVERPWLWLPLPALLLLLIGLFLRWRYPYLRLGLRVNADGSALRRQAQSFAHPTMEEMARAIQHEEAAQYALRNT